MSRPRPAPSAGLPRFHVEEAAPGARVELPEHTAHHAREVLRLRPGAAVRVFDGRGAEFAAVLEQVSRRAVWARLAGPVTPRPESPLFLALAISPLKGDRMELVLQKATELGVAEIRPVVTIRTDAAARPALHGARDERWHRVVSGAAEQCGRALVPRVAPAETLPALIAAPFAGSRVALVETPGHPPLTSLPLAPGSSLMLLVGPAGGFEATEIETLHGAGFLSASLGPRILRSETAAISTIAIAQALWGDLRP